MWFLPVISEPGKKRQVEPWDSLINQLSPIGEFWVSERYCLKDNVDST